MRYILLLIFALITTYTSAQIQYLGSPTTTVRNRGNFVSDSLFYLPKRSKTPSDTAAIRYQISDSTIYVWTGGSWRSIGRAGASFLAISDTSAMLSPYIRHAGNGLTKTGQALAVDTFTIATRNRAQKQVDSLGGIMVNTTTGQNISGNKIFANDITFNGQAITKLLTLPNKDGLNGYSYVRSKSTGVNFRDIYFPNDSGTVVLDKTIGSYISSNISGTTNYIPKFTASSTIGNSQIFDDGTNVGINTTSPATYGGARLAAYQASGSTIIASKTDDATGGAGIYLEGSNSSNNITQIRQFSASTAGTISGINLASGSFLYTSATSAGPLAIVQQASQPILFATGGSERMRVTSAGNVHIGATSDALTDAGRTLLSVNGSSNSIISMRSGGTLAGFLYANGTSSFDIVSNNIPMRFAMGASVTERMRLQSDGELLIGTTTDAGAYALQVAGDIYNTGGALFAQSSGNVGIGISGPTSKLHVNGTVRADVLRSNSYAQFEYWYRAYANMSTTNATPANFATVLNGTLYYRLFDVTQQSGLGSAGYVIGIHDDNNGYGYTWQLLSDFSGNMALRAASSSTTWKAPYMVWKDGGNVGIGTTSPSGILDISKSTSGGDVRVYMRNTATTASSTFTLDLSEDGLLRSGIQYSPNTGETKFGNITTGSYAVTFYAGAAERIRLHNNGGLKFVGQSAAPTAEAGTVYYDTDDNKLKVYNGTTWVDLH